jgi:hypothetical protein
MKIGQRVGIISTRLAGTDGVSLETVKWVKVLSSLGYECYYFAGESEWPEDRTYLLPEAHFNQADIESLNHDLFDDYRRLIETSAEISRLKKYIKTHLHLFIEKFSLDVLIAENILSIPMNIPLGLALTEVIVETDIPTIAHHHDFSWERDRFAISGAEDYLRAAFPPTIRQIRHVVINSFAQQQLALRTGLSSTLIPNVMEFRKSPPERDEYTQDMKDELGIDQDEHILLQPTRIVPRKRIELSIELARRLDRKCVVLISHESGDEGKKYEEYLRDYAKFIGVKVIFGTGRFDYVRGESSSGKKIYSLADAPIVMSTYEIFKTDIQPKGFKIIGFGDYIDNGCIAASRQILDDPAKALEMTEINFSIGLRHYSFSTLEYLLSSLLNDCIGA